MNSLISYSILMGAFSLIDLVFPTVGSPSMDLGFAFILLGLGLAAKDGREV
jgi:hypothetical protein